MLTNLKKQNCKLNAGLLIYIGKYDYTLIKTVVVHLHILVPIHKSQQMYSNWLTIFKSRQQNKQKQSIFYARWNWDKVTQLPTYICELFCLPVTGACLTKHIPVLRTFRNCQPNVPRFMLRCYMYIYIATLLYWKAIFELHGDSVTVHGPEMSMETITLTCPWSWNALFKRWDLFVIPYAEI